MGLFSSRPNLELPRINPDEVIEKGIDLGDKFAGATGKFINRGVGQATEASGLAAEGALDLGERLAPRIKEGQERFNPEFFRALQEQERLATGDLAQRLEAEASGRLGTGITFDEERALREASRGAFTSRGRFRDTASTFDELTRRLRADRQARMQNTQFAQGVLGFRSNLLQQPLSTRQGLFLDPRTASGFSGQNLFTSGAGLGQTALGAGIGMSQEAALENMRAQATEIAANRKEGFGLSLVKGMVDAPSSIGVAMGGMGRGSTGSNAGKGGAAGATAGGGAAKGAAKGGGMTKLFSLFSDSKLKRNIKKIGMDVRGFGIYSWSYLWDNETHTGVMADEVKDIIPDAVSEHSSGYLMVDYSKIGV